MQLVITRLSLIVVLVYFGSARSENEDSENSCAKLNEQCIKTEDCCLGTCAGKHCSDGLHKNNRDRAGFASEPSQMIEIELNTGMNVDISSHKNAHMLPTYENCGYASTGPKRQKRIVGGTPYELGKYPWAASLHINEITNGTSHFSCGGSLINKRYVITAAHCVTRLQTAVMLKWVTLGNVDRRLKTECEKSSDCNNKTYVDVEIEDWIVHEGYSEAHVRHDIALIKLKHDVNFTDYIRPICLPKSENIFKKWPDGKLTVIGWGTQNVPVDKGFAVTSWRAQEVQNTLVHRSNCDRFYTRSIGNLRKSQICAGGYPGKGDCAGDSGGSLFKNLILDEEADGEGLERFVLFGLVSTGAVVECAREGKPSVYTSIMYHMRWVLDNLVQKPKLVAENIGPMLVNPVSEFATGMTPPMDESQHANVALLPAFPDCGQIEALQDRPGPSEVTPPSDAPRRVKRIVGGIMQSVGSHPWMAQIYARHVVTAEPYLRCSGVLISTRTVLTAAHCVADLKGSFVLDGVVLGNFNRREKLECIGQECNEQKVIPIEDIITHASFTKFARENDVAIIKLARDVVFTRFIRPICLPLSENIVAKAWPGTGTDRRYTAVGWGRVSPESAEAVMSNLLVAVNLTLESKKYCETTLTRKVGRLENSRICGGGTAPGKGECIGDTGGPMMRWVTLPGPDGKMLTRMFTFGVLSIVECAHQGIPSLYQNLLYHMPWIMKHLSDQ